MKRILVTVAVLACLTVGLGQAVPAHRTLSGRTSPTTTSGVLIHAATRLAIRKDAGYVRPLSVPPHIGTAVCVESTNGSPVKPCRPVCATTGPRTICLGRQVAYNHVGPERWHARYVRAARSLARLEASAAVPWLTARVTAYASFENLTGCHSPGVCYQACGGTLNDRAYTVASNPSLGLACGTRIVVCGSRCVEATVEDRTASSFDMEFSYSLALATGASSAGWDSPRDIRWRRA